GTPCPAETRGRGPPRADLATLAALPGRVRARPDRRLCPRLPVLLHPGCAPISRPRAGPLRPADVGTAPGRARRPGDAADPSGHESDERPLAGRPGRAGRGRG